MFLFCVLILQYTLYTAPGQPDSLGIIIENISGSEGLIRICLFDNEADFMRNPVLCKEVRKFSEPNHFLAFRVPSDRPYALIVYHDLNDNGRLDRNFLGIPREPYGFSNNPSTRFGPPGFHEASFDSSQNNSITIRL